jgi:NAD(P)-dependent dehydrogenase (short-subunit alcohol dehydrogenase family)
VPERILITGGDGSTARAIASLFKQRDPVVEIYLPSRSEMDVTDELQVIDYIKQHPCDLLICAAGSTEDQLIGKTSEESWDRVMQVNLRGAVLCAKEASKSMLKQRCGHIIFISSYSAVHPPAGQIAYASAKAGLLGVTKALAKEWGRTNIRVNTISPGMINTPFSQGLMSNEDFMKKRLSQTPLRRVGEVEEIAGLAVMLAAQAGGFITGQNIIVDGGTTISDGN